MLFDPFEVGVPMEDDEIQRIQLSPSIEKESVKLAPATNHESVKLTKLAETDGRAEQANPTLVARSSVCSRRSRQPVDDPLWMTLSLR